MTDVWAGGAGTPSVANWRTQNAALLVPQTAAGSPHVDSLAPTVGTVGTHVTITGTDLGSVTLVQFGNVAASIQSVTPTSISAIVPSGATTWPVTVSTPDGSQASSADTFVVKPRITAFPPSSYSGDFIVAQGTNLDDPGSTLTIGDIALFVDTEDSTSTRIIAYVPYNTPSGPLTITTDSGAFTTSTPLTVVSPVGPLNGLHGTVGTSVSIPANQSEVYFPATTGVKFTGYAGGAPSVTATFHATTTSLKATVPGAAVSGPIAVYLDGAPVYTDDGFVVDPKVSSVSPSSGPIGTTVTIAGSGLDSTSVATFGGGATANHAAGSTATALKVVVPVGAVTGKITVGTSSSSVHPQTGTFTVTPRITDFNPKVAQVGTTITVNGSSLTDAGAVLKVGSKVVTPNAGATSTSLTFDVPDGAVTGKLAITTAGGTFTTPNSLGIKPTISSFTPTHATTGTQIVIGGNTLTGVTSVKFTGFAGGQTVTASSTTSGGLFKVTVPSAAVSGPITITNAGGATTSTTPFVVDPKLTSMNPSTGAVGATVTFAGSGFDSTAVATFTSSQDALPQPGSSATSLKVKVPTGAVTGTVLLHTTASSVSVTTASFTVPGTLRAMVW